MGSLNFRKSNFVTLGMIANADTSDETSAFSISYSKKEAILQSYIKAK